MKDISLFKFVLCYLTICLLFFEFDGIANNGGMLYFFLLIFFGGNFISGVSGAKAASSITL